MTWDIMTKPKNNRKWRIVAGLALLIVLYFIALAYYWVTPRLLLP